MKYICPLIVVEDIKRSRELYEQLLGLTVKFDFGENVTFHGDFAIHQKAHFKKLIDDRPILIGSNTFELYFEDDDPDAVAVKVKEFGLEFVHEVREQPWRQKVVRFYDYDENMIEVGESLEYLAYRLSQEGLSTAEISKTTYLPEEVVLKSIEAYSK